jgi:hypothetical protein
MLLRIRSGFLALLFAGCLPTGAAIPEAEFAKNRAIWESHAPAAYEFTFRRSCECLPEQTIPVRVTVRDGQIQSVVSQVSGEPVAPESHRTLEIEGLFTRIGAALDSGAHRVVVTYDPVYGYPASVLIDEHPRSVDDEVYFTATDLRIVD